jgi:hypothetical protein
VWAAHFMGVGQVQVQLRGMIEETTTNLVGEVSVLLVFTVTYNVYCNVWCDFESPTGRLNIDFG